MLDQKHFAATLQGLADQLPFGKQITGPGLILAWQTMPTQAKQELTDAHWTYAAGQYLLDPERPKEVPVFLALLRYLYRLENDSPNLAWGLKADLAERMAEPAVFHPQPIAPYLLPPEQHDTEPTAGILEGLDRMFTLPPAQK